MSTISAGTTSTTTLIHSGDTTGSLVLKTNDTGTGGTTAVTIDTSQNVGIGTTSPSSFAGLAVRKSVASVSGISNASFQASDAANSTLWVGHTSGSTNLVSDQALSLGYTNGTTYSERMRIDTSGNVGIGTASPIRKLTLSQASSPEFVLQESSGATNAKNWRIFNSGNQLYFGTLNDAGSAGVDCFRMNSSQQLLNASGRPVLQQSGSILQVQNVYLTSTTQLTSSGALHELTTSLRIAFTPVSTSSTIFLECYGSFVSPQSNNLQYAAFYDVTNSAYVNLPPASGSRKQIHWFNRTTSFDVNDAAFMYFSIPVANTSTTARTYTVYHGTEGSVIQFLASTLSSASGATYPLVFTITEVAA